MSDLKTRIYLLAEKLNIAEQTVKNHVHRMQRKVGTSERLMIGERVQQFLQYGPTESRHSDVLRAGYSS